MQTVSVNYNLRPLSSTRRLSRPVSAVGASPSHQKRITHLSMSPLKHDIYKSLEPWAAENLLPFLKPVEKCWQPRDLLPDPARPVNDFSDEVRALRDRSRGIPDEYFVVLAGNMITEDALPTYQSLFNITEGVRDENGSSPSPWATWNRAWSAEENRHGDLLRTYLYLSGRVDMLMVEKTVQYLIGAGMDVGFESHPYLALVYTSFQERATFVSHSNMARLAKEGGDPTLAKICGTIAADEKRHEGAYVRVVEKLLEVDTNEAMVAIGKMLRKRITMPAHLMYDGHDPQLFEHFAYVAHRMGVYTPDDYAGILEFLVTRWGLENTRGLDDDGEREQEFVCTLAARIRRLQARADERAGKEGFDNLKFSWIFNKNISFQN